MTLDRSSTWRAACALMFTLSAGAVSCAGKSDAPLGADVQVDEDPVVRGIPDKGRDPAVVAIDLDGEGICSGTLIAPDIVLTARHCVVRSLSEERCPAGGPQIEGPRDPATLLVLAGDDLSSAQVVARGREIVEPEGDLLCDADVALLLLDRTIDGIQPLDVRLSGVAQGDHVRTVGFGRRSPTEPSTVKLLREHVPVLDATSAEFRVGEATCQGDSGGPAFDEASGEVVGVVSRGGPSCTGKPIHNVYTRTDVFYSLVDRAFQLDPSGVSDGDAGSRRRRDGGTKPHAPRAHKLPTDLGSACHDAEDCGAAVCVLDPVGQYCTQGCDAYDPCPTHFKCSRSGTGDFVCVEK